MLDVLYEDGPFDNAAVPGASMAADTAPARNGGGSPPDAVAGDEGTPQPSDVQPSDVQPSDVQPSDVQPSDVQPSDVQPSDPQPSDADGFSILDLRTSQPEPSPPQGRHARHGASND
jgi:hypothetical protein